MNFFVCHQCKKEKNPVYEVVSNNVDMMIHTHYYHNELDKYELFPYKVLLMQVRTEQEARKFYGLKVTNK